MAGTVNDVSRSEYKCEGLLLCCNVMQLIGSCFPSVQVICAALHGKCKDGASMLHCGQQTHNPPPLAAHQQRALHPTPAVKLQLSDVVFAQVIAAESEEADKVKSVVSQEEAVASKEAAGVKAIKVLSATAYGTACGENTCTSGFSASLLLLLFMTHY